MTTEPLAPRLRTAVVDVRVELDVSRHVFRNGPSYVVRDPVSFKSHRFDSADYTILASLSQHRTLGETFALLVSCGALTPDNEEAFYEFIVDLHRQGILTLPINDSDALYRRYERRRAAARKSAALSIFFFKVPLWNPDRFLAATVPFFAWAFTRTALVAWAILMLVAGALAASRWSELTTPLLSSLSGDNLFFLWGTLVALKIVHEFGHAYACKVFGGHVPEMGAMLVLLTPCAYVDASDSWSFDERRKRIGVALAGVYFESVVGALALFVWAATEPGVLNTVAYQAVLLSTVVTVGFNLNPLMKYDGYFVASDLAGIPNLRARAQAQVSLLVRRFVVGRRALVSPEPVRHALLAFGAAASAYRVAIVLSLCTLIAIKFDALGLALAAIYLCTSTIGLFVKSARYLVRSPEARAARARTIACTLAAVVLIPAASMFLPVPLPINARGVVERDHRTVHRAPEPAFLHSIDVRPGQHVAAGDLLATLKSPALDAQLHEARAQLAAARLVRDREERASRAAAGPAQAEVDRWTARIADLERRHAALDVRAAGDTHVINIPRTPPGAPLLPGAELATTAHDTWRVVVLLDERDLGLLRVHPGDRVPCRTAADPAHLHWARIQSIEPVGSRQITEVALTSAAGGDIASRAPDLANPEDGAHAANVHFRVILEIENPDATLAHGGTARVRLDADPLTLGQRARRAMDRFLMKVRAGHSAA